MPRKILGEITAAAAVWAAMKAKTKIGMRLKNKEEEEEANTSGSKTRRYPINPAVIGGSQFIGWRSGGSRKGRE